MEHQVHFIANIKCPSNIDLHVQLGGALLRRKISQSNWGQIRYSTEYLKLSYLHLFVAS